MMNRARSRSRPAEPPISHASISVVKPLPPKNSQERRMQFGNNEKRANPYQADRMIPPIGANKNDPRLKRRQEEGEKKQHKEHKQYGAKPARTSICVSPAVPNEQSYGAKQARTSICVSQAANANPRNNIPYEESHKQQRQIGAKRARTSISISPAANPRNNIPNEESADSHSPTPSDSNFDGFHSHEKRRRSMPSSTEFADWFQQGKQIAHKIEENIEEYSVREAKVGKLQTSFSQFLEHVKFLVEKE